MRLTLDELESCLRILTRMLRIRGVESIDSEEIGVDFYWSMSVDEQIGLGVDPTLDVGSLEDDLVELQKLLKADSCPSLVDLERLASALKFLSYRLESET